MNRLERINKPIIKVVGTLILFLFIYVLLGNSIQASIENILLSKARAHSQEYSFALTPLTNEKYIENAERLSLIEISKYDRKGDLVVNDARASALRQFLMDYNSPMYPYAETFVVEADKYDLDWRLVAAISGVESAFGNLSIRPNNAWGWRGGAGGDFNPFDSWNHGIEVVTRRLALGYGIHMTPFEIEPIYCPPCGRNPAHLWANGVIKFMNQIDMYMTGF
jgi:hypothetical protein